MALPTVHHTGSTHRLVWSGAVRPSPPPPGESGAGSDVTLPPETRAAARGTPRSIGTEAAPTRSGHCGWIQRRKHRRLTIHNDPVKTRLMAVSFSYTSVPKLTVNMILQKQVTSLPPMTNWTEGTTYLAVTNITRNLSPCAYLKTSR